MLEVKALKEVDAPDTYCIAITEHGLDAPTHLLNPYAAKNLHQQLGDVLRAIERDESINESLR